MTSIFVAKLDFGITNDLLKEAFQEYGTVLKASVATDRETGKSRGFGFVEMADREEAENAIKNLDGSMMNGRPIAVKEAEQRTDSRPPRDASAPRPEFNRTRPPGSFQRSESKPGDFPRPDNDDSPGTPLTPSSFKSEVRKKEKKVVERDVDNRSKKPKMDAYKKSGKNNRFFEEDNDEDWDDNSADNSVDSNYDDDDNNEDYDDDNED